MAYNDIHLEPDSIKEALCEFRFDTSELAEIIIGRLADAPIWRAFVKTRLPSADIPPQIRAMDPALAFQPSYELRSPDTPELLIRVGAKTLSCHFVGAYPGWAHFRPLLVETIKALFAAIPDVPIQRIGFRYVNALNEQQHHISHAKALNLDVKIGGEDVTDAFALNYRRLLSDSHICQVTVATPEYVVTPETFNVLVDIDIFTSNGYASTSQEPVMAWIDFAHDELKKQFFTLLPAEIVDRLRKG